MTAFTLFLGLALGFGVVMEVLDDIVPMHIPTALSRTFAAALAVGAAWALKYSVFASSHEGVRNETLGYVATGLALVGTGELLRAVWPAIGSRRSTAS
ncbi:MAG TPA: hypothetical protein VHE83_18860 [Mycobacteriales bacterium]|nr:hypothetical protein [Mycobacteriales bacterium]